MSDIAPGWQLDPTGKHDHRYWDGTQWTENVANAGVASIDPYVAPAPEIPADAPPPISATSLFGSAHEPTGPEASPTPGEPVLSTPEDEPHTSYAPYSSEQPVETEAQTAPESPYTESPYAESPYAESPDTDAPDTGDADAADPVADETLVDHTAFAAPTDVFPAVDQPTSWPYDGAAESDPAPPPPYVPTSTDSSSRFGDLGNRLGGLGNLGDGTRRGLAVGGGILVAVILAVVAMNALGGDDDPSTTPIGSSGTTNGSDTTDTTAPPKDGEYGSDPALDVLYDGCEDGDFAACDQLYLNSAGGSGYQTFGDTCGGRNEPSGYCVKLYKDDGGGDGGAASDGGVPEEETLAEDYAVLGLDADQAECLAGKFREAVENGTLQEDDAMTGVVELLADCDISLEDLSSN